MSAFHRYSAFRGIRIKYSKNIRVEGLVLLNPPHYSIYIGKSTHVHISNFKSFSSKGWCEGIDMMASSDIEIDDVFLRTSDDCIAVYGSRWDYHGDTRRITVRNSVLWADVAHPLMMGTHGDHRLSGDVIEDIRFENIDILEHHELQENYWGAMAINADDKNKIRRVVYDNIRVEEFELGQLIDIRVIWNKDYNPEPGHSIEDISFRNITYFGRNVNPNRIYGFDAERQVKGVVFENLRIRDELVLEPEQGNFDINAFTQEITFTVETKLRNEGK
ncbi:glycosyl hydrolase family 28 protein [Paenibacillus sp. DCT19]|uniref:glycosyl hydrolase family 28 protein n=1 Tax=Paenibacillus sp. DCT19 TaxID=2211212 RepID=UPI0020C2ABB3|nr:glycosyl hydrolase family 28 protein [Paenibacillus sp. DCT19]